MESHERTCQLCHRTGLKRFEIPGSSVLWLCEPCELYQYGHVVEQSAYESSYHAGYEKNRAKKIRTARVRLNRAASLVKGGSGPLSILDIGCSVGATLEAARYFDWNAVGVDVSEDAVSYCQRQGLQATKVDGTQLPFETGQFDIVVNWHVVEHVADVRQTLEEWKRVLKPGGLLFMETPDAASPKVRKKGTAYRSFWAPEHTYTFTYSNLSKFLEQTGLEVVDGPWVGNPKNHGAWFAPYAYGYRLFHGMRKIAGLHKEFQIFARKPMQDLAKKHAMVPQAA